jgi:hypothetical protein
MKLEVKEVKINRAMSEETPCYSCNVVLDGKRIGTCSNRGCGGDSDLHIKDREVEKRLRRWAAGLPEVDLMAGTGEEPMMYRRSLEGVIEDLVCKWDADRSFHRKAGKELAFRAVGYPYEPYAYSALEYGKGGVAEEKGKAVAFLESKYPAGVEVIDSVGQLQCGRNKGWTL